MNGIEPTLDHLVYATPDLEATVARFEQDTGISPAPGGRHIGLGTRNCLVSFSQSSYLEIIGPDVLHPVPEGTAMPFGIENLAAPRLITWAVHPVDLRRAVLASRAAGADLGAPRRMKRKTPGGTLLQWTLASTVPAPFEGVTPFLIDWGTTPSPAADPELPRLTLLDFSLTHPEPPAVQRVLEALSIAVDLRQGPPGLRAVLDTPRGQLVLD